MGIIRFRSNNEKNINLLCVGPCVYFMMMAIIDDIRQEENVNNNQRETMEAIDGDN